MKAKKIVDNDLDTILDAARMKLKQLGFKDASKAVKFLAQDPEQHGELVIDKLAIQGTKNCSQIIIKHFLGSDTDVERLAFTLHRASPLLVWHLWHLVWHPL